MLPSTPVEQVYRTCSQASGTRWDSVRSGTGAQRAIGLQRSGTTARQRSPSLFLYFSLYCTCCPCRCGCVPRKWLAPQSFTTCRICSVLLLAGFGNFYLPRVKPDASASESESAPLHERSSSAKQRFEKPAITSHTMPCCETIALPRQEAGRKMLALCA